MRPRRTPPCPLPLILLQGIRQEIRRVFAAAGYSLPADRLAYLARAELSALQARRGGLAGVIPGRLLLRIGLQWQRAMPLALGTGSAGRQQGDSRDGRSDSLAPKVAQIQEELEGGVLNPLKVNVKDPVSGKVYGRLERLS